MRQSGYFTVLIASVAVAFLGADVRAGNPEALAAKTIERLGGDIVREKIRIGEIVVNVIVDVNLHYKEPTIDDLKVIGGLKHLRVFRVNSTHVTGEGLNQLATIPHLETLDLCGTLVTDEDVKAIGQFRELRTLELNGTKLTDV